MSNFTDFFPAAGGGGGGIPKYQEFTSSGTFTPTQALIDAGGRVSLFMVGGGASGKDAGSWYVGGTGGEVIFKLDTLTSTSGIVITIGAGGNNSAGGNSIFAGSSAGGTNITSYGGSYSNSQYNFIDDRLSSGAGAASGSGEWHTAQNGTFGYGAGGAGYYQPGVYNPKTNSGQGGLYSGAGASGFIRVTWFE
tara:strand:- start:1896 stop:2474 length:579 start_codon:yes stop_codon:yes gene_type:complete